MTPSCTVFGTVQGGFGLFVRPADSRRCRVSSGREVEFAEEAQDSVDFACVDQAASRP
jgi:hypothetical protein